MGTTGCACIPPQNGKTDCFTSTARLSRCRPTSLKNGRKPTALALDFAYYSFCRLRVTPGKWKQGSPDYIWTLQGLIGSSALWLSRYLGANRSRRSHQHRRHQLIQRAKDLFRSLRATRQGPSRWTQRQVGYAGHFPTQSANNSRSARISTTQITILKSGKGDRTGSQGRNSLRLTNFAKSTSTDEAHLPVKTYTRRA